MKTVLLTGAGGFLGRTSISHLLQRDYVVHAVTSRSSNKVAGVFYHDVDLLDQRRSDDLVESVKPTHLLHLAWYVEHGKFWNAPENVLWLRASSHLVNSFAAHGGKRIVMAGTCAEYDWQNDQERFSETNSPIKPQTIYGKSKNELHKKLRGQAALLDLSYAWGRIFFLFGAFEPPNRFIPSIIRALIEDREAECSHGDQIRDFMYVEDAGEAFVRLLDSNVQGPINIASGSPKTMKEIAETIGEMIGRPRLLRFGAKPSAPNEPKRIVADVTRLREEVAFDPQTDLAAALQRTIEWWKKHL